MTVGTVAVIIPCYNQGQHVAAAIDSALGQTYPAVRVVVVDDGSEDHTAGVCERYGPRINYILQANSGLPAAARNTGLLASTSEFIQFLDADDRIEPTKIEEQVEAMRRDPEVGVVYSDGYLIDQAGKRIGPAGVNHPSGWVYHDLLTMWGTQVAAVLVRRSCLALTGIFNTDRAVRGSEDVDLWLRLAARFKFQALPEKRFEYRVGAESVSSNAEAMMRAGLEVLRRNVGVHPNCEECRRAIAAGRRRWKSVMAFGLMSQARHQARAGDWVGAARGLGTVARLHPAHLLKTLNPKHLSSKVAAVLGK